MVLNVSTSEIFPLQPTEGTGNPWRPVCLAKVSDRWCLKIWAHKQTLQRLVVALAKLKSGNTSENLLSKILQLTYIFVSTKCILKSLEQYDEFNKVIKKWVLHLWILKIVKYLILIDYYSNCQIKWA